MLLLLFCFFFCFCFYFSFCFGALVCLFCFFICIAFCVVFVFSHICCILQPCRLLPVTERLSQSIVWSGGRQRAVCRCVTPALHCPMRWGGCCLPPTTSAESRWETPSYTCLFLPKYWMFELLMVRCDKPCETNQSAWWFINTRWLDECQLYIVSAIQWLTETSTDFFFFCGL